MRPANANPEPVSSGSFLQWLRAIFPTRIPRTEPTNGMRKPALANRNDNIARNDICPDGERVRVASLWYRLTTGRSIRYEKTKYRGKRIRKVPCMSAQPLMNGRGKMSAAKTPRKRNPTARAAAPTPWNIPIAREVFNILTDANPFILIRLNQHGTSVRTASQHGQS